MSKQTVFYYHFEPINAWFIFNSVLLITFGYWSIKCPCLLYWHQTQILWGVTFFSWAVWAWKYLLKHKLAVIDAKSITIDHCAPLFWKDVKTAEVREVRCGLRKLKIIVLIPKDSIKYKYNFLQKHNGAFTPFSLPLYDVVTEEDRAKLRQIIAQKLKVKL